MGDVIKNIGISVADFDLSLVHRQGCMPVFKTCDDLLHTSHPEFKHLWCDRITEMRRETGFTSDWYVLVLHYTSEAYRDKPPLEETR